MCSAVKSKPSTAESAIGLSSMVKTTCVHPEQLTQPLKIKNVTCKNVTKKHNAFKGFQMTRGRCLTLLVASHQLRSRHFGSGSRFALCIPSSPLPRCSACRSNFSLAGSNPGSPGELGDPPFPLNPPSTPKTIVAKFSIAHTSLLH